jgi:hypothetical protein
MSNPGKWEKDKALWRWLNYALGKHIRGRNAWVVQVEDGAGRVTNYKTKESVQEAIFNEEHWKRYDLAEEALIYQGVLRERLVWLLFGCGKSNHLNRAPMSNFHSLST